MTETLGQRITRLRGEHGMSQGDLADALDISRQSVSKWETDTSTPELEKLIRLAEVFDISMDALILGKEPTITDRAEEPPTPLTQNPPVKLGYRRPEISQTQKFVGIGLIGISILFALLIVTLHGTLEAMVSAFFLSSPLWGCGIICLTVRRRIGLWCAWLIFLTVTGYLYYATGTSRGAIFNPQFWIYGDVFRITTTGIENILLLGLFLWTFFSFRGIRCPIRLRMKSLIGAYVGCTVGYLLFSMLFKLWVPRILFTYLAKDHLSVLSSFYHILMFTVSTVDLLWLLALILGARMLYNERKAQTSQTV